MDNIRLESRTRLKNGTGYFLKAADGYRILSSDTFLKESKGAVRKLGISVSSSCRVGCRYCFTNRYPSYRQLSENEITQQAYFLLNSNPDLCSRYSLKISLKQMGDPVLNSKNVLKALRRFAINLPGAMQVVSTSAPKNNGEFFRDLQAIQDRGANIRLQFSCHTTSDAERAYLSPKIRMMSLSEIGKVANEWRGQKVTLNFVIFEGYTYDVKELEKIFSPEKVFIKLNHIDHNELTQKSGFRDAVKSIRNVFSEELERAGYQFAYRNT